MKTGLILIGMTLLLAATAYGEQKDAFWEKMQSRLEKVTPAKKGTTTTAVGGVRGAKNDESADIYWKGKDRVSDVGEEELQKFSQAVDCKLKGDNEAALKQFEEFLAAYPQSSLRLDGLQAVDRIKNDMAAAKNTRQDSTAPAVTDTAPAAAPPVK